MSDIVLGIQNSILSGKKCRNDVLSKLSDVHLEKLLARLATILSEIESAASEELCKYCSWSKPNLKPNVVSDSSQKDHSTKYKQFLRSAISNISQFCVPPSAAMNYKRKRKSVLEITNTGKFNRVAYVKVCDIIHQKKYFMRAMQLLPSTAPVAETNASTETEGRTETEEGTVTEGGTVTKGGTETKGCTETEASTETNADQQVNKRYKTLIPFSSEIGKKYVKSRRYQMTDHLRTRKRQYTEGYLNTNIIQNSNRTKNYEVTFNKDTEECTHMYNFPKRRMKQNEKYLKHLIAAKCKPVCVSLKRMDLTGFGKKCVVSVERMDISKYLNKNT